MDLILYKDILIKYISKKISNKYLTQIKRILANDNTVFLYNRKYFMFIKELIDESDEDIFNSFAKMIIDKNESVGKSNEESKTFEDEILQINLKSKGDILLNLTYEKNKKLQAFSNVVELSKQEKPNYHWIAVELAMSHPNKITANCFDFNSNSQIKIFFNDVYSLPKEIKNTNIFDTQCNLEHDKFDFLKSNKVKIFYYTNFRSREKDKFDRRDAIKGKFGNSAKVYLTKRGIKAHGRRLLFNNIIISTDQDFWNLEINSSDWTIDVQYSVEDTRKWLLFRNNYSEFR